MNVMKILERRKKPVMKEIFKQIGTGKPKLLYDMMADYPKRSGKGLRPALVMISAEAYGANPKNAVLTATALEMFQNWVLIHDDIEDGSEERRGTPCLHLIHGTPLAINAGDALHIKMWRTMAKNRKVLGEQKAFRVIEKMGEMLDRTVEGQTMELSWMENNDWDVSEKDYYTMIYKKTAWYTVIGPIQFGALIAGRGKAKAIHDFGDALGKAFQLQDDILNLVADQGTYGKEIAGDIYEGKRTLIFIHLMKNCTKAEKKKIVAIMNKPREKKTKADVKWILSLMHKHGSVDYAKKAADKYAKKAKRLFPKLGVKKNKAGKELEAIIDFIVDREL